MKVTFPEERVVTDWWIRNGQRITAASNGISLFLLTVKDTTGAERFHLVLLIHALEATY